MLRQYPRLKELKTKEAVEYTEAISKALDEAKALNRGEDIIKAIDMIYFRKTHTIDGVADKLHASRRLVQRWLHNFVVKVGYYKGFEDS